MTSRHTLYDREISDELSIIYKKKSVDLVHSRLILLLPSLMFPAKSAPRGNPKTQLVWSRPMRIRMRTHGSAELVLCTCNAINISGAGSVIISVRSATAPQVKFFTRDRLKVSVS